MDGSRQITLTERRCLHTRCIRAHSRASGEHRRIIILRVLAGSRLPLGVAEIVRRTRLPRRTVYYYLRQLLARGLARRLGRPRCMGVLYTITAGGREYLARSCVWAENNGGGSGCANSWGRLLDGVRGGRGGCGGAGCRVLGRVVVQERGDGGREVGLRVGFGVFRRVLAGVGVSGFGRFGPRRLRYGMFYVRGGGEGTVHFDFYVGLDRFGAVSAGLWAVRGRVLALVAVAFSLLKWYGYTEGFVRELWRRVPRLELEDVVYLEDGRGRRVGVWDPGAEEFVAVQPGLDVFLGG